MDGHQLLPLGFHSIIHEKIHCSGLIPRLSVREQNRSSLPKARLLGGAVVAPRLPTTGPASTFSKSCRGWRFFLPTCPPPLSYMGIRPALWSAGFPSLPPAIPCPLHPFQESPLTDLLHTHFPISICFSEDLD